LKVNATVVAWKLPLAFGPEAAIDSSPSQFTELRRVLFVCGPGPRPICYRNSSAKVTQTVFRPALRAGLELALAARAAPDVAVLVLGHPEAAVHPASAEVEDEAPAQ
jgi:hypothetical protein